MIQIDRQKIYESHGFKFKNFVCLIDEESINAWKWRNDESIRKWMYNKDLIPLKNHLEFIENLSSRDDKYYWLVYDNNTPIGVVNVIGIQREEDRAEMGLYMRPDSETFGFEFVRQCFYFFFEVLKIGRLYCSVDKDNRDALLVDAFFGCEFNSEKILDDGKVYLESINLDASIFSEKYNQKFGSFLKFCRNYINA